MSTRDIVKKRTSRVLEVQLSDGDTVYIRTLSGTERDAFRDLVDKTKLNGGLKPKLIVALALCEQDGTRVYDHEKPDDIREVGDMDGADLDAIAMKFLSASGLTEKAVEELEKK